MGGGNWSASTFSATRNYQRSRGIDPFAHTATQKSRAASTWVAHEDLDPARMNSAGKRVRECFDSDEHPNTTPIAVLFDVTGSMGDIPKLLADKLTNLFGLLLRKGYCEDPQVLVGGIGDAFTDRVPLQISQFEADNRIDANLTNIFLEANGGGQGMESYGLGFWFMANLVDLDVVKKHNRKGYLFVIGDEKAYPTIDPVQVKDLVGEELTEPVSLLDAIEACKEKWEVFWIYPAEAHYFAQGYAKFWQDIFGERCIVVDDIANVCETIGATIGILEGAVDDLDDALSDLDEIGAGSAKGTVSRALATLSSSGGGALAVSNSPKDLGGSGTERL